MNFNIQHKLKEKKKNIKIFDIILFLFIVMFFTILILVAYKSEIVLHGYSRENYYGITFFLLFLITFCLFTFKRNYEFRVNICLVGISLTITCYGIEFLMYQDLKSIAKRFYESTNGTVSHRKSDIEYIEENAKIGDIVLPRILPAFFITSNGIDIIGEFFFPFGGIANRKTLLCNESGEMITFHSDRYGFNNNDNVWDSIKSIDITIIGDSFAQGDCVSRNDNIAGNLEKLEGYKVLNLGMGGNGPLIELATLSEYYKEIDSDYLLWFYFEGNDLIELVTEQSSNVLMKYLIDNKYTQNLIENQSKIDASIQSWLTKRKAYSKDERIFSFDAFIKLKKIRATFQKISNPSNQNELHNSNVINIFENVIQQLSLRYADKTRIKLVYLPAYERYSSPKYLDNFNIHKNKILAISKKHNIDTIDIDEILFNQNQDPLDFFPNRLNGHYNVNGYRKVAEVISLNIKEK